jgi:hypothetical protein
MKPESFRELIFGAVLPKVAELEGTHVFLREVEAEDLESVFVQLQGEFWSPNGEARFLILSKGLAHTSMSVGDVVEAEGKFWAAAPFGFTELLQ